MGHNDGCGTKVIFGVVAVAIVEIVFFLVVYPLLLLVDPKYGEISFPLTLLAVFFIFVAIFVDRWWFWFLTYLVFIFGVFISYFEGDLTYRRVFLAFWIALSFIVTLVLLLNRFVAIPAEANNWGDTEIEIVMRISMLICSIIVGIIVTAIVNFFLPL